MLRRRLSAEQGEQIDSMNLLLYMAPVVLLSLVPTTIILEPGALVSMRELSQQHQCEFGLHTTPRGTHIRVTDPAPPSPS